MSIEEEYPLDPLPKKFVPILTKGYVCKVYDADTITVISKLHDKGDYYRFSIRLTGIDTPELRTKNLIEKKISIEARDKLRERILNKIVQLKTLTADKYGRLLCEVYYEGVYLNQWLLDEHYAVPYDGGTKHIPDNWEEYRNNR